MKVPRDIMKSPRAMELALTTLWTSSGETQFILRHWRGQIRPYYSLEIVSIGGAHAIRRFVADLPSGAGVRRLAARSLVNLTRGMRLVNFQFDLGASYSASRGSDRHLPFAPSRASEPD